MKKIALVVLACILCMSTALAYDVVMLNTNVWQEQYLGSVFAAREEAQVYTFADLSDIQLKLRTIPSDAEIYVIESNSDFVLGEFARYIQNFGFENVDSIKTSSYLELQEQLFDYSSGIILLNDEFGYESLTIFTLVMSGEYDPFFLNEESLNTATNVVQTSQKSMLVGHYPLWLRSEIEPLVDEAYVGLEDANVVELMGQLSEGKDWGLIMDPIYTDLNAIQAGNPVFVYTGQTQLLADLIDASQITNYEVIGSDLVNTVTAVERNLGYDVRFLVKYARTITGIQGLQGKLLEVDTVLIPFPFSALTLTDAYYYEEEGILTVGYQNIGSVDVLFSASVESGSQIISDPQVYMVRTGDTITISYDVAEYSEEVNVNTQFDRKLPLRKSIATEDGLPLVTLPVEKKSSLLLESPIVESMSIDSKGILEASVLNPNDVEMTYVVQVYVNESNQLLPLASESTVLPAGRVSVVSIDAQYTNQSSLREVAVQSVSHYGSELQWFKQDQEVFVEKRSDTPLLVILVVIAVLLLIALVLFIFTKRK